MYQTLRKLYYGDAEVYQQTYAERFRSPATVHLDFDIAGNPAFFVQTNEAVCLLQKILQKDKEVYRLRRALPGEAVQQYTLKCLIDEIVLTNKIEGVNSSRKEIGEVLYELRSQSQKRGARKRFDGLVNQYLKLQTGERVSLASCADIRALYDEIVLEEVVEENPQNAPDGALFRKDLAEVYNAADKVIHRGSYPEEKIIAQMEKALAFLQEESVPKLFRVCLFHYLLEYIHPFYDGNGRLGRFLISNLLAQDLNPLIAYRISYTITENINDYYAAFRTCNDPHNLGDMTPFLLMMLTMIEKSVSQLEEALQKRKTRLHQYSEILRTLPIGDKKTGNLCYVLIQAALFSEHGISTRELEECLDSSYSTVKKALDIVDAAGFLLMKKVGKEKCYSLNLEKMDQILFDTAKMQADPE